jgi:putative membrane protein
MRQWTTELKAGLIAGALAALAIAGCKKSGGYASDTTGAKIDTGRTLGGTLADSGTPAGRFADGSVLGFSTVANRGEIALGKLGEKMATNPTVKSFAGMLVTQHEKIAASIRQLASKLSVMPDTLSGDARDLLSHDADEIRDLVGKPRGADWDKDFINQAIEGHQKILSELQDAAKNSPSASVRASLERASAIIQEHLTKAQDIKKNVLKD